MSTVIRPELSNKNKYWISRHRYYELKHYCLQYSEWEEEYLRLGDYILQSHNICPSDDPFSDPTAKIAVRRTELLDKMNMLKKLAKEADEALWPYIFQGVTQGVSFVYLRYTMEMPAEKSMYYDRYRRFFWLLSKSHR